MRFLLVLAKRVASKFHVVNGYCKRCGRGMVPAWTTTNDAYRSVVADERELCIQCFDRAARKIGKFYIWRPT